jgi:hypothetical protein
MKRAEREAQWAKHIEGWKQSGLTQPRYCERESISYDTFKRWRQRLETAGGVRGAAARFVPVEIAPKSAPRATAEAGALFGRAGAGRGAEIRLANGRAIGLGAELDEVALGRLIRLLEVLAC